MMGVEYLSKRSGPMSAAPSQLGVFAKSNEDLAYPDLQYHIQPLSLDRFGEPLHKFPGLTASVCNLRPTSRGSVTLQSPDVRIPPAIDPNYLSTDHDRDLAVSALRHARHLLSAESFSRFEPLEHSPGAHLTSYDDLLAAAADIASPIFHPVGTCKMGPASDPTAVVGSNLCVHGLDGLRVVDASIMPSITSGNTNSPSIMIGEKGSQLILAHDTVADQPEGHLTHEIAASL
jgi:choline dehydrogenase